MAETAASSTAHLQPFEEAEKSRGFEVCRRQDGCVEKSRLLEGGDRLGAIDGSYHERA